MNCLRNSASYCSSLCKERIRFVECLAIMNQITHMQNILSGIWNSSLFNSWSMNHVLQSISAQWSTQFPLYHLFQLPVFLDEYNWLIKVFIVFQTLILTSSLSSVTNTTLYFLLLSSFAITNLWPYFFRAFLAYSPIRTKKEKK